MAEIKRATCSYPECDKPAKFGSRRDPNRFSCDDDYHKRTIFGDVPSFVNKQDKEHFAKTGKWPWE